MPLTPNPLNALAEEIIGAAIRVHRDLGPGLLESVYEECLTFEVVRGGLRVERQRPFPVTYQGTVMDKAFRVDLMVEDAIVVEVKALDRILKVHQSQLLTYLRLAHRPLGLLFNFNVRRLMDDGFRRVVNHLVAVP